MNPKQLSIVITAQNQAAPVFRNVETAAVRMFLKINDASKSADGAQDNLVKRSSHLPKIAAAFGGAAAATAEHTVRALATLAASITKVTSGVIAGGAAFAAWNMSSVMEQATAVDHLARRLGSSAEEISGLKFAAEQADLPFESLARHATLAAGNLSEVARTGKGPALRAVRDLGLSLRDAAGRMRPVTQLLPEIARGLKSVGDEGDRIDLANDIFGKKGGQEFLDFLNEAGEGIDTLAVSMAQAQKLGAVWTDDEVRRLDAMGDAFNRVRQATRGVFVRIGAAIAPDVIRLLDKVAAAIAALPKIAGNIAQVLRDAFGFGPAASEARKKIDELGVAALDMLEGVVAHGGKILLAGVPPLIDFTADMIDSRFGAKVKSLGEKIPIWLAIGWNRAADRYAVGELKEILPRNKFFDGIFNMSDTTLQQMELGASLYLQQIENSYKGTVSEMNRMTVDGVKGLRLFDPEKYPAFTGAVKEARGDLAKLGTAFMDALDHVTGYRAAIGETTADVERLREELRSLLGDLRSPEQRSNWKKFTDGVDLGIAQMTDQAQNFGKVGQDVFVTGVQGWTSGMASALVDSRASLERFRDSAVDVAADVAAGVSKMILQFLLLRAVMGAIGGLSSGLDVPASATSTAAGATVSPGGTTLDFGVLNRGGYVTQHARILEFAGGGYVPGPSVNRDIVPAMLTPGERVLNRDEVRDLSKGAGPVTIQVNTTVNVQGGGGGGLAAADLRSIDEAVASGLERVLRTRPQVREMLARRLTT